MRKKENIYPPLFLWMTACDGRSGMGDQVSMAATDSGEGKGRRAIERGVDGR